jgi:hypothetical protein
MCGLSCFPMGVGYREDATCGPSCAPPWESVIGETQRVGLLLVLAWESVMAQTLVMCR